MGVFWAIELNAMAWVGTQTPFVYGRPRSVSSLPTIDTTGLTTHCYRSAGSIAISKCHSVRDRHRTPAYLHQSRLSLDLACRTWMPTSTLHRPPAENLRDEGFFLARVGAIETLQPPTTPIMAHPFPRIFSQWWVERPIARGDPNTNARVIQGENPTGRQGRSPD